MQKGVRSERVSPIKVKPLRTAGQSLDDRIYALTTGRATDHFVIIVACLVAAGNEWIRWLTNLPPSPKLVSIAAGAVIVCSLASLFRLRRELQSLKLGRDGERAVAELLDSLRAKGYSIFHDVPGNGFNLDHVLIAPQGVFVVETKTHSKRTDSRVFFDGARVLVDGMEPERDPLTQARAEAKWLHDALMQSTGKRFPVRAVVVYPGWYVESSKGANRGDLWVLNPNGVESFIDHERVVLTPPDVHLAAHRVSLMSRNGSD